MIRIDNIKLPVDYSEKALRNAICDSLKLSSGEISEITIYKRSLDARKKDNIHYIFSVLVTLKNDKSFKFNPKKHKDVSYFTPKEFKPVILGQLNLDRPPVVVGSGPAGLFCAYYLAKYGYKPILIERGDCIEERTKKVDAFWKGGQLDPESNVQFGEGGAGTYSDGKLNTMVKDTEGRIRCVLKTFVENGAPDDILYVNKPHIGTDLLKPVISAMSQKIREMGGLVRYRSKLTGLVAENITVNSNNADSVGAISESKITGIIVNGTEKIECGALVLALGHSARDTFKMLLDSGIHMEPKAFAVGVRVEHPQDFISRAQYGDFADKLPPADYKLTHTTESGRGVYSFCMCPGGYVVNASSEEGRLAVNGMSNRARNSGNANSAIIVTVNPSDFENADSNPLAGTAFQQRLEKLAYDEGKGKIPQQFYADFKANRTSLEIPSASVSGKRQEETGFENFANRSCTGGLTSPGNLRNVLPEFISESIIESMPAFDRAIPGFMRDDMIMSGVESRTSSPVRMNRNDELQCNIAGIYPCGEGAGYAGGIVSAAADGLRVFEAIIHKYKPTE